MEGITFALKLIFSFKESFGSSTTSAATTPQPNKEVVSQKLDEIIFHLNALLHDKYGQEPLLAINQVPKSNILSKSEAIDKYNAIHQTTIVSLFNISRQESIKEFGTSALIVSSMKVISAKLPLVKFKNEN